MQIILQVSLILNATGQSITQVRLKRSWRNLNFAVACKSGISLMSARNKALISLVPHISPIRYWPISNVDH